MTESRYYPDFAAAGSPLGYRSFSDISARIVVLSAVQPVMQVCALVGRFGST